MMTIRTHALLLPLSWAYDLLLAFRMAGTDPCIRISNAKVIPVEELAYRWKFSVRNEWNNDLLAHIP